MALTSAARGYGVRWGAGSGQPLGGHFFSTLRPQAAGSVQSVDASTGNFTITTKSGSSLIVTTSSTTTYRKPGATSASFADVTAGEQVLVMGTTSADGSLAASQVLITPQGFGRHNFSGHPAAAGSVQSVDPSTDSFTIKTTSGSSLIVTTSSTTTYRKPGATSASFADISTGEQVLVMGTTSADGSLAASQVLIAPQGFGRHNFSGHPAAAGSVQSVDASAGSFTITTKSGSSLIVTTSSTTTYRKPGATSASFADISTGEQVLVMGTTSADGSLAASQVLITPQGLGGGHGSHAFRFRTPMGSGGQAVTQDT